MSNTVNPISPKVHRFLYNYSIKRFLESNIEDLPEYISELEIDLGEDMGYSKLLDALINAGKLTQNQVDRFLLNELNYGRSRNVFVSFIQYTSHLSSEEKIIKYVNSLRRKGYKNAERVSNYPVMFDLRRGIDRGESKLIHFDIEKDQNEEVSNISLLLAQGVVNNNGEGANNYIGIEINLKYKMLVVKLRNWESTNEHNYGLDTLHKSVQDDIKNTFNLTIPLLSATSQKLIYNMINELTGKVLDKAINTVNSVLEEKVNNKLKEWTSEIISENVSLTESDFNVFKEIILNNYYRVYMQNEIGVLKVGNLKDKFEVNGYPRYVKFIDDTIGEGRARSSDPQESLLDTSIFYDIKARLDQSKQIKMATIYWIDSPGYDYLGTSFYTDNQERFKFVVLANFFNKEICDYVLRQIDKYRPG